MPTFYPTYGWGKSDAEKDADHLQELSGIGIGYSLPVTDYNPWPVVTTNHYRIDIESFDFGSKTDGSFNSYWGQYHHSILDLFEQQTPWSDITTTYSLETNSWWAGYNSLSFSESESHDDTRVVSAFHETDLIRFGDIALITGEIDSVHVQHDKIDFSSFQIGDLGGSTVHQVNDSLDLFEQWNPGHLFQATETAHQDSLTWSAYALDYYASGTHTETVHVQDSHSVDFWGFNLGKG